MTTFNQRAALDTLSKPRLLEIAAAFDLEVSSRLRKGELVDALASSQRAPFRHALQLLSRDELKAICRAAGLDDSGREKARLAERILRRGVRDRSTVPRAALATFTKAELVEDVVAATGTTKALAEVAVAAFFESIVEALHSGSRVELRGFGTFGVRQRGPRMGRNPRTGAKVKVPAKGVAFFKPGKDLKKLVGPQT